MRVFYTLVHSITGYSVGKYESYSAAECARGMMDDWELWSIEPINN